MEEVTSEAEEACDRVKASPALRTDDASEASDTDDTSVVSPSDSPTRCMQLFV